MRKVIVTNAGRLKEKYGPGFARIEAAVQALVDADAARGITTELVALDDAERMKALDAMPVESWANPHENKEALDDVCAALDADTVLLLGSKDVVPHQDVRNPLRLESIEDDASLESDLPYACAHGYSKDPARFLNPVRAVGRLPGLTGGNNPVALMSMLHTATYTQPRMSRAYQQYFAVAAAMCEASARATLEHLFGRTQELHVCPPQTHRWAVPELAGRIHLVNALGVKGGRRNFGSAEGEHVAHDAAWIHGRIPDDVVAASTAGYAADLGAPLQGPLPICYAYLTSGAVAFLGASTRSWGAPGGFDWADLLTQSFLQRVLAGESTGAALLGARRSYLAGKAVLTPLDLKTIHQFSLLGDPSARPVETFGATDETRGPDALPRTSMDEFDAVKLPQRIAYAVPALQHRGAPAVVQAIKAAAANLRFAKHLRFDLETIPRAGAGSEAVETFEGGVHLLFGQAAGEGRLLAKVFLEHGGRCVYATDAAHR